MRTIVVLSTLLSLASCGPEQPDLFCQGNDDCEEGRLCETFTKRCVLDRKRVWPGYEVWGHFVCTEPDVATNTQGYVAYGMLPSVFATVGGTTEGQSFVYSGSFCALTYQETGGFWTLSGVIGVREENPPYLMMSLYEHQFTPGDVTSGPAGYYWFAIMDRGTPVWGGTEGLIRVTEAWVDEHPYVVAGEFLAKGGL